MMMLCETMAVEGAMKWALVGVDEGGAGGVNEGGGADFDVLK
jgi:hypothetical protein